MLAKLVKEKAARQKEESEGRRQEAKAEGRMKKAEVRSWKFRSGAAEARRVGNCREIGEDVVRASSRARNPHGFRSRF
jgi:hypothetical protein